MMASVKESVEIFRRFDQELRSLGGAAWLLNEEGISEKIVTIIQSIDARNVAIQRGRFLSALSLEGRLNAIEGVQVEWLAETRPARWQRETYRRNLEKVDLAITAADYLIADTATVVLSSRNFPSRLLTLLPPALIVVASANQLVPDLFTFHKNCLPEISESGSTLTLITGPSRTADIQKMLILGVHGPKHLFVLVIQER